MVSLLQNNKNRHFSHVKKRHIFKNLNLAKKNNWKFCSNLLKNHFRHLTLYSNSQSWLARSYHMGTFWKRKSWNSHFWEGQPFRFCYVGFYCQRRLKCTKTGIATLNWRLLHAQKPKIWSTFCGKKFLLENFVV